MRISTTITRAATAAISLASFAQGQISTPMNYSAPAANRLQILNQAAFELTAADLYDANPGIFSVELHSGGVISQIYSPDNSSLFLDMYAYTSTKQQYATMWNGGKTFIAGPSSLLTIQGYGLYVRQPVFISANKSKATFWGTGNVVFKVSGPAGFLRLMNISELRHRHRMEHALWTFTASGKLLTLDRSEAANMPLLMTSAMRMTLPVGEPGKACFFAIFPTDGEVTDNISHDKIALVVLVVLVGALVVVAAYYGALLMLFRRRHRLAPTPAKGAPTYMALLTLRGAQAVVEHCPEEAQRVFTSFIDTVRMASVRHGCYAVMPIGDRCLYVVGSDLKATLSTASECVSGIQHIVATADVVVQRESASVGGENLITCHCSAVVRAVANTTRHYDSKNDVYFYGTSRDLGRAGSLLDQLKPRELGWSDGVDALCAANGLGPYLADLSSSHGGSSRRVRDKGRLAMVCVQWGSTGDSEDDEEGALDIKNNNDIRPKKNRGDSSDDDASTAMVIMSDVLLKKLTSRNDREALSTIVTSKLKKVISAEKNKDKEPPQDDRTTASSSAYSTPTNKAQCDAMTTAKQGMHDEATRNEAAMLSRSCTVLAIRINGDPRVAFDTVKRVVEENRGRVVCCYENVIIAAYNLLSAGGHHQLRAADTVVRLRARLDGVVPFVAAIHHGKLSALVSASDGLVMVTGEVIQTCRVLLARASDMSRQLALAQVTSQGPDGAVATFVVSDSEPTALPTPAPETTTVGSEIHHAFSGSSHGLCLLYCQAEMSSVYDCEAVDIEVRVVGAERKVNSSIVSTTTTTSTITYPVTIDHSAAIKTSTRIVYRLGVSKSTIGTLTHVCTRDQPGLGVLTRANLISGAAPASGADDEWMYQLKDDQSAHSAVNFIFTRLQAGDVGEAKLLYRRLCEDGRLMAGLSVVVRRNLSRLVDDPSTPTKL